MMCLLSDCEPCGLAVLIHQSMLSTEQHPGRTCALLLGKPVSHGDAGMDAGQDSCAALRSVYHIHSRWLQQLCSAFGCFPLSSGVHAHLVRLVHLGHGHSCVSCQAEQEDKAVAVSSIWMSPLSLHPSHMGCHEQSVQSDPGQS